MQRAMVLQVPSDAEIMVAQLHLERKQRIHVPAPASSFADDIHAIHGEPPSGGSACLPTSWSAMLPVPFAAARGTDPCKSLAIFKSSAVLVHQNRHS